MIRNDIAPPGHKDGIRVRAGAQGSQTGLRPDTPIVTRRVVFFSVRAIV